MLTLHRFRQVNRLLAAGLMFMGLFLWTSRAHADPATASALQCPNPGEPCKILTVTASEERMLVGANGVFDTAAQGRALELGQFVVYMKTRIAQAPSGEVKKVEEPAKPATTPAPDTSAHKPQ